MFTKVIPAKEMPLEELFLTSQEIRKLLFLQAITARVPQLRIATPASSNTTPDSQGYGSRDVPDPSMLMTSPSCARVAAW